jgi:hypothetical protein
MNYILTAVLVVLFTTGFLWAYKAFVNPQVVYSPDVKNASKCPDRWNYNSDTGMCEPAYSTPCFPFNPDAVAMNSSVAKCNVAQSCGTSWSGICP